jgi:transposase
MTDWKMYSQIQELKNKGFKKTPISQKLELDFRTVDKYWNMTPEEFHDSLIISKSRAKRADHYREVIIDWLTSHPDMSSAQVYDWLLERFGDQITFSERTTRLYVAKLRVTEEIPKPVKFRDYEAVEELPMGFQSQVDMGEIWVKHISGRKLKVYCFAMVLSHSRHKYIWWQDKPFTTADFINCHERAFAFYGGMPKEIVYDQDKVLAVSENNGDIIYTEAFETYKSILKFKVYLCRGADPESKGKVEAVVKYAKNNFAKNRTFTTIENLNDECTKWLERRGNGKKHETTQKIPAEVFALEREHLVPVNKYEANASTKSVTYQVRKDNTVLYRTNRYSVPKGTYKPGLTVNLKIKGNSLIISDTESGFLYARHTLCIGKGELVKLDHGVRELNKTLTELLEIVSEAFHNSNSINTFIEGIRHEKPRYIRDQLSLIRKVCEHPEYSKNKEEALEFCLKNRHYSASEFHTTAVYLSETKKVPVRASPLLVFPKKKPQVKPAIRDISEYTQAIGGS